MSRSGPIAAMADLVTPTSAIGPFGVIVFATPALFSSLGSSVEVDAVAILVKNVPAGVAAGMCSVISNVTVAPAANRASEQSTVPPPPAAGVTQVIAGPEVWVSATKVMPAG